MARPAAGAPPATLCEVCMLIFSLVPGMGAGVDNCARSKWAGGFDHMTSPPSHAVIGLSPDPPGAPDSDAPSNGRRASPKPLRPTLLATVAAAPVALTVRAFRGTASSPKTVGRVLVHLAMLSTASGWQLPQSMAPEETITGEAHESASTGGVDGHDRRLLVASGCDSSWCAERPARACSPPLA